MTDTVLTEQQKYEAVWQHAQYRDCAPGEEIAQVFLAHARPKPKSQVIDFGAGTGRGALMLAIMGDCKVHMLDFASNCLDEDVRNALTTQNHMLSFTQHDLTQTVPISAAYGFCTDVMEHIPPADVDHVLQNILLAAQHVFFQISCVEDNLGKLIGHPLHLSVHPYAWWLKKLQDLDCIVHWSADYVTHAMFYVTAWPDGKEFVNSGVLNTDLEQIRTNVKTNIAGDWMQVSPHETNDIDAMILCGGPSLNDHLDTIKQLRAEGVKLITVNGAYNWAIERGLLPSCQVIVDARAHNARFVQPVMHAQPERNYTGCVYLMSSQVDPSVLVGLPEDRTYLWHTTTEDIRDLLNERYDIWYAMPGGSTVVLRTIPMMRTLGYKRFHMFGWDSCLMPQHDGNFTADRSKDVLLPPLHHAYAQPENDGQLVVPVTCGERIFHCHPWMVSQAQEVQDLIRFLGEEIELEVYGDGLIAYMLRTGARLQDEKEEEKIELS